MRRGIGHKSPSRKLTSSLAQRVQTSSALCQVCFVLNDSAVLYLHVPCRHLCPMLCTRLVAGLHLVCLILPVASTVSWSLVLQRSQWHHHSQHCILGRTPHLLRMVEDGPHGHKQVSGGVYFNNAPQDGSTFRACTWGQCQRPGRSCPTPYLHLINIVIYSDTNDLIFWIFCRHTDSTPIRRSMTECLWDRRFWASLLLLTSCEISCCNWRVSCVATEQQKKNHIRNAHRWCAVIKKPRSAWLNTPTMDLGLKGKRIHM